MVVGAGVCGLAAAAMAAAGGARVMLLEKAQRPGGNASRSTATIAAAGSRLQRLAGISDSPEEFRQELGAHSRDDTNREAVEALCNVAPVLVDWLLDEVGVPLELVLDYARPEYAKQRLHATRDRSGLPLVWALEAAATGRKNVSMIQAGVRRLIASADGAVTGVEAETENGARRIAAGKVILALGGFAANKAMVRQYVPAVATALYFGIEGATGEGIRWGVELGAQLVAMDTYCAHASVAYPHAVLMPRAIALAGAVLVNAEGQRFGDESRSFSSLALQVLRQPGRVALEMFDQRIYDLAMRYASFAECVSAGAVFGPYQSAADLAQAFGIPARTLTETLRQVNGVAAGAATDANGRDISEPLTPPLYGVQVTGALFETRGGLLVDGNARVLRKDGQPVPNLYAGGGTAAGLTGGDGGGNLPGVGLLSALGLGYLAGRHAAAHL